MSKQVLALLLVFAVFLFAGLWFHLQRGLYLDGRFWKETAVGEFTSPSEDRIQYQSPGHYLLTLGKETLTVRQQTDEDGIRVDFSDGISLFIPQDALPAFEMDGIYWIDRFEYMIRDFSALRFEPAQPVTVTPFYDEEGRAVGESRLLATASGKVIHFEERWTAHPEWNQPPLVTDTLLPGARLTHEALWNRVYQNTSGDYLMNPEAISSLPTTDNSVLRLHFAQLMQSIERGESERRGSIAIVLLYAFIYAVGALTFLFPEEAAFFGSRWQYRSKPELSDAGLIMRKLGGIVFMVAAVIILFIHP